MRLWRKKIFIIPTIIFGSILILLYPSYLLTKIIFNSYFEKWGEKLVSLEKKGLLSKEFGAAWQDVLAGDAMEKEVGDFSRKDNVTSDSVLIVDGISVKNYPSLSIVARLNEVHAYSNTININDRNDLNIATIRTDHTRARISEFPPVLTTALIAAEDSRFYDNNLGFEFKSFVRAVISASIKSITTFSLSSPRGTSTITQQVAKLFVSHLDKTGQRQVSRSIDRKIRELRISSALRKMYSADEILEVYLNHCVASDFGLIGVKDIALGLFNKNLDELNAAECVYIARMVKWGSNIHSKIAKQCRIDIPRIGKALGWSKQYQEKVLNSIDKLTFVKPKQIESKYGHLVDLANEFWLLYLKKSNKNKNDYKETMDIINPNSLIRRKGNLSIRLNIDLPLQRFLEKLVDTRGYGQDTIIHTDMRIGSFGENVKLDFKPVDTLRMVTVIDTPAQFSEQNSDYYTTLQPGDTLITNTRYRKISKNEWRRSCYYYTRRKIQVDGQYFSYCIIDSRTGKMLAYYSRDKIGSRLLCLLKNRVPNGSSTAKPILNALNFDLGIFPAYSKWSDSLPVTEDVPWKRKLVRKGGKPYEVIFANSAVPGRGYRMHNHGYTFEGCRYIFDHLATSNNIFGVESIYRLNKKLFDPNGKIIPEAFPWVQFLYRINALDYLKKNLKLKTVTGVRLYKELARIVGITVDTVTAYGKKVAVSDSLYSVALGTLEMTLYEQVHLFNMLYNNNLIENPAEHPGLVIDQIDMNGVLVDVCKSDTIKRYHPLSDINNIRPTYLGMHKRLISNRWDGLVDYDISYNLDTSYAVNKDTSYNQDAFLIDGCLSNYAKSGTTDDILRPFNVDVTSKKRTNYGLWNAVIRIDLARLSSDSVPDIRDITISCIGECNRQYTGARDGKSLHKYVSRDMLKKCGIKAPNGFFSQYEDYIINVKPDSVLNCGETYKSTTGEEKQTENIDESDLDY